MSAPPQPSPEEVTDLARLLTGQGTEEVPPLSPEAALASAHGALAALYGEAECSFPVLTVRQGFHYAAVPGSGVLVVSVWDDTMWRTIGEVQVQI